MRLRKSMYKVLVMPYNICMNKDIGALTRTQMSLIQMHVETFGRSVDQVSQELELPRSVVQAVVDENKFEPNSKPVSSDSITEGELQRQAAFLPEYVVLESLLIGKAKDFVENLNPRDEDFSIKFSSVVKSIKDMRNTTSVAASQAASNSANATAGIQLNIVNQF